MDPKRQIHCIHSKHDSPADFQILRPFQCEQSLLTLSTFYFSMKTCMRTTPCKPAARMTLQPVACSKSSAGSSLGHGCGQPHGATQRPWLPPRMIVTWLADVTRVVLDVTDLTYSRIGAHEPMHAPASEEAACASNCMVPDSNLFEAKPNGSPAVACNCSLM